MAGGFLLFSPPFQLKSFHFFRQIFGKILLTNPSLWCIIPSSVKSLTLQNGEERRPCGWQKT